VALPPPPLPVPDWRRPGVALTPDQRAAADALAGRVRAGGFAATLLDGVTGSGKTEVYFEAVAAALAAGRQVLVLLPEIALSAQWLDRFAARFGTRPAEWHSDLTQARRRRTWRAVASGEARVVVGARSALFLPFADLGLIVVDEEHEGAYKQEDGVVYHARDMAVVRAHLGRIPIVLVSATPSLETVVNAEAGRYDRLHLPERVGGAVLPHIDPVDLRAAPPPRGRFLSPALADALTATLAAGEQSMLFLNRRGYAPLTLCRRCGHRLQCPHCTAWLVEHRLTGRLKCHHCGHEAVLPSQCPSCAAEASFVACGPGVERIAEEAAALLPEARLAVMASDLIHGPAEAEALVRRVAAHEVDLVVGTQLVAKGHHFPLLTLVGVVDADLGLAGGDLRAGERTYQLLHQVAGRAGRAERPGRVLIQTYQPDHPAMRALADGDRDRFLALEAEERRSGGWPPFGRLAALIVSAPEAGMADEACRRLARRAPRAGEALRVLGPAEAPMAILRGRHRRRFLVKAARSVPLQKALAAWLASVDLPNAVKLQVDIDPYSFW
jgi:primosomal protein N' (replication factor Y)